jgi:hypothetical protein
MTFDQTFRSLPNLWVLIKAFDSKVFKEIHIMQKIPVFYGKFLYFFRGNPKYYS